jgi:hypothetical protein
MRGEFLDRSFTMYTQLYMAILTAEGGSGEYGLIAGPMMMCL